MAESSLQMVVHTLLISIVFYILMFYVMKQDQNKAIDRSLLLGGIVHIYMILYGHKMPSLGNLNPNIYSA